MSQNTAVYSAPAHYAQLEGQYNNEGINLHWLAGLGGHNWRLGEG